MRKVKWILLTLVGLVVAAFLHYTLPQHDVVRIVGVRQELMTLGWENRIFFSQADAGMANSDARTVKLIDAIDPQGRPRVYRNEDTGWWGWPPYFKLDSQNLQAQAQNLTSTEANPRWVRVTHYGWRNTWITIFPNAVALKEVAGPDVRTIPWVSLTILAMLAILVLLLRRMWLQFRERMIDPAIAEVSQTWDEAAGRAELAGKQAKGAWGRFTAWLGTWWRRPRG
ncbi:MAG: DUF1523 family protein [Rhodobacteraceae bacterium]|nr:DUF1523 family protein [Paracoccaceae bacterium]